MVASWSGTRARAMSVHDAVPRSAGGIAPSKRSATASTIAAAATAPTSRPSEDGSRPPMASAAMPVAPAMITREFVQISHRSRGFERSRRGRSTSRPAAPTTIAASGPNNTPAKMKITDETETSTVGLRRIDSFSAIRARKLSAATAYGEPIPMPLAMSDPVRAPAAEMRMPAYAAKTHSVDVRPDLVGSCLSALNRLNLTLSSDTFILAVSP